MTQHPFDEAEMIYSYTRRQAIEDGVLIDLTQWAKETGFKYPVACTATVWNQYIVPPAQEENTRDLGQCERGRAHDLRSVPDSVSAAFIIGAAPSSSMPGSRAYSTNLLRCSSTSALLPS